MRPLRLLRLLPVRQSVTLRDDESFQLSARRLVAVGPQARLSLPRLPAVVALVLLSARIRTSAFAAHAAQRLRLAEFRMGHGELNYYQLIGLNV
jgi:hypothetical protein